MTTYYTVTGNPADLNRGSSSLIRSEFLLIQAGFVSVDSTFTTYTGLLALKGNVNNQTWTGAHVFTGATITVPTQSTGDNSSYAASTAYVVATVNAASGVTLPIQTGNAGKYLTTNGTTPSWSSLSYQGASAASGSVTLTSTSNCVQVVTPTTLGQYVTLPNATTMTVGGISFVLRNSSDYDLGIVDAAGNKLGWIKPREVSTIGCGDISTSAGIWTITNVEKVGITARLFNGTLAAGTIQQRIALDSNRTFFLVLATNLYGVIYDAANLSWGALTLIRNSVQTTACCLSATNQVLVTSCTSTTAFEAVTLTISANTTITPNTAATSVLGGNIVTFNTNSIFGLQGIVPMGSGGTSIFVCSYGRAATTCVSRGMTISGTTVTIGTELVHTPTVAVAPQIFSVTSSVGFAFIGDATNIHAMPFTWSGANLAAGTNATKAGTSTNNKCFPMGSGNFGCLYNNATLFGGIISFAGSVATFNSLSVINQSVAAPGSGADISVVSTTKFLASASVSNVVYLNNLTDTAGVASAGTQTTYADAGSPLVINVSSNIVRVASNTGTQAIVDCSGTSPSITTVLASTGTFSSGTVSSVYGYRSSLFMSSGGTVVTISALGSQHRMTHYPNSSKIEFLTFPGHTASVAGTSENELFTYSSAANTLFIQRLESAT